VWKASTADNGNGTYAVQFQVDRAGHWIILPRCRPSSDYDMLPGSMYKLSCIDDLCVVAYASTLQHARTEHMPSARVAIKLCCGTVRPHPCMLCHRVNGKAVREGGYEVQASFGPLSAAHCCVLGGDVGAVVCGGATDFHVAPHDADVTGRKVPHQDALSVTVTGVIQNARLNTTLPGPHPRFALFAWCIPVLRLKRVQFWQALDKMPLASV